MPEVRTVLANQGAHVAAVRVLLSLGADLRLSLTNGVAALGFAKHKNYTSIAALLRPSSGSWLLVPPSERRQH